MKPTMIAIQRLSPAHSLSSGPASAVTTKGAANMIETVSASCMWRTAKKLKTVEPSRHSALKICNPQRRLFSTWGMRQRRNSSTA